jgi:hypothetical protein
MEMNWPEKRKWLALEDDFRISGSCDLLVEVPQFTEAMISAKSANKHR